jgi:hypothetical protein
VGDHSKDCQSPAEAMKDATTWPDDARHCLRVGSLSDKRVIEASADHFDVLVVQGNLAISAPQALATWSLDKPVWIDPITYAFSASPAYLRSEGKKGGYKRTFSRLAEAYGAPYTTALEHNQSLTPGAFSAVDLGASVERVIAWQSNVFEPPEEDRKYGATAISPALLTIPYFPLAVRDLASPDPPDWFKVNLAMISEAAARYPSDRLAAGFLAELDVFDHDNFGVWLDTLIERLQETGINHLWWWISDHEEVETSLQRAARLLSSFQKLDQAGIKVHQAFGGSLSSLALAHGLTSVGHGINYWEQKGWEPISTGGLPVARYFHPRLRERLRVPEAIAIIDLVIASADEFFAQVCSCDICREVIGSNLANFGAYGEVNIKTRRTRGGGTAEFDSPTPEALFRTKCHFLHAKGAEVAQAIAPGFRASEILRADAEFWANDLTRTRHLDRWALALDL